MLLDYKLELFNQRKYWIKLDVSHVSQQNKLKLFNALGFQLKSWKTMISYNILLCKINIVFFAYKIFLILVWLTRAKKFKVFLGANLKLTISVIIII